MLWVEIDAGQLESAFCPHTKYYIPYTKYMSYQTFTNDGFPLMHLQYSNVSYISFYTISVLSDCEQYYQGYNLEKLPPESGL